MSAAVFPERLAKRESPYPGLRPFEPEESHLFFGRDQQIADLADRLERNHLVAVVGVSGCGKSSLVRAGLIPALERGRISTRFSWRLVLVKPGDNPFERLAGGLAKQGLDASHLRRSSYGLVEVARQLPPNHTLLVIVDQFEELFRYKDRIRQRDDAQSQRELASATSDFVQLILAGSSRESIYFVLTMRSDYLGYCAEFRGLPEALNDSQYLVPRLTREQRKEAIEGPLGRTSIEASLVQRMLNDAGEEPGRLPVLQHALKRTWNQWHSDDPERKRGIQHQDYEKVGGVRRALDRHANELLEQADRRIAETVFKRLAI